ncbi:hypothetical protein ACMWLG_21685, partial [Enterobacter sp. 01-M-02-SI-ECC]
RCVCGKKIGPDPRNFNQRVSLGRNDLLIRTFLSGDSSELNAKSSWIKQVTRYADFYSNQLNLVRDALKLPKKWKPNGIHKMIITTSVFGDIYHQKDCYVIDKNSFYSFIE